MHKKHIVIALYIALLPVAIGCSRALMPTPNLYLEQADDNNPFRDVPLELQNNKVDILYVTDRTPISAKGDRLQYGYGRSRSMAFGSCVVEIGKDVEWSVLVENSRTSKRTVSLSLEVDKITEHARFPETPIPVISTGEGPKLDPKIVQAENNTIAKLQEEIKKRLKITKHKEAFVYIHGFNNKFDEGIFVASELWHFIGRRGVPIVYSWPSKKSLIGYGYDRESSEFTVFHFKQFLRAIAGCDDLKKIHILAHSRGTDVVASTLREMVIASNASGEIARNTLDKVGNVVFAAADIDMEVASQRLSAEMAFMGAERVTIYLSQEDKALNFAAWLFESIGRLGELSLRIISLDQRETFEIIDRVDFIDARVDSGFLGHGYFHSSPAVSSDLILLLRDNLKPGKEHGRPLTPDKQSTRYWSIGKDYPRAKSE